MKASWVKLLVNVLSTAAEEWVMMLNPIHNIMHETQGKGLWLFPVHWRFIQNEQNMIN